MFINPDPDAGPLEDFIGGLASHFERWDLGNRYVQAHVGKEIRANWKIAQEAFCEAFHVNATHPQILPYIGDTNSQVDVWDTFSRVITPAATPSPLLDWAPDEETILRYALDVRVDEELFITIKEGQTARSAMADATRDRWRPIVGAVVDEWSDAEMVDNLDYTLFPNFHPWGAFNRIVYRFRPNGDDHRSSIMEVFFLAPFKGERPPPSPVHLLGRGRAVDGRAGARRARQGVRAGHVQHGEGAARPREHPQARDHAGQLPGEQGPLVAPAPRRVDGRTTERMNGVIHPFSKALYEQDGEGNVLVKQTDGRAGRYRRDGSWVDGQVFDVDPQLCNWVGGPKAQHRLQSEPKIS